MADTTEFEKWAIPEGFDCAKSDKTELGDVNLAPGKYLHRSTQAAFSGWLAAKTSRKEEPDRLALLRDAVVAKARYRDALRRLEKDCTDGQEFTEAHLEEIEALLDNFAAGVFIPSGIEEQVTDAEVSLLQDILDR